MKKNGFIRGNYAYEYPLLIKHLLKPSLLMFSDREIIYRDLKRYTYRDFYRRVHKAANALKDLGVKPGTVVGVMDWDSTRYLELYFAVPMMGAILHTVNIRLAPKQILYTINHAEDEILFINKDFLPIIDAIGGHFDSVKKKVFLTDDPEAELPSGFEGEYEQLVGRANETFDFPDFDENTIATLFYTSGTTGNPKGVFFSHRQLVLHTLGALTALTAYETNGRISSDDVYMPLTPMFHVHAWGIPYLSTVLGVKQVYPGRYEPAMILNLFKDEGVTFSHCVPTILQMVLTHPEAEKVDLSGWKVVIGGAALPQSLCRLGLKRGIDVYAGYGMSETCPILTLARLKPSMLQYPMEKQIPIRCRTGLPIIFADVKLMDPEGKLLPHDGKSVGEVVVRSPWLTAGYFKEEEKSKELWRGKWLHTGDVAYFDEEGYLQITDRIKDVIKSGGEWVSSLLLEDILTGFEGVSEAMAIGVPDEKWGEKPLGVVVLKASYKGRNEEEVKREIKKHVMKFVEDGTLLKWAVPEIEIVDSLPKTSTGKLDKKVVREQYREKYATNV